MKSVSRWPSSRTGREVGHGRSGRVQIFRQPNVYNLHLVYANSFNQNNSIMNASSLSQLSLDIGCELGYLPQQTKHALYILNNHLSILVLFIQSCTMKKHFI